MLVVVAFFFSLALLLPKKHLKTGFTIREHPNPMLQNGFVATRCSGTGSCLLKTGRSKPQPLLNLQTHRNRIHYPMKLTIPTCYRSRHQ